MESIESKRYIKNLHNLLLRVFHDELKDPIFRRLTINHLKLNRTRTEATVYLDLESSPDPKLVIGKLNKLQGLFRNSLSLYLNKYRIPRLKFVEDRLLSRAKRVEELIMKDGENAKE